MRIIACLTLSLLAWTAGAASAGAPPPVAAVWKVRHVNFVYRGRTARYSCEGLREKLRAMLLDLGVRRDLKMVSRGCGDAGHAPVGGASLGLDLTFSAPALANAPPPRGATAGIDARFETFTITSDAFRNMGVGDCELVSAFTQQILPKLATRAVRHDIACDPHRESGNRFWVRGEVLRPQRNATGP